MYIYIYTYIYIYMILVYISLPLARWSVEWLAIRAWPLLEIRFIDMINFFERVSIERERTPRSAVEARDKLRAH